MLKKKAYNHQELPCREGRATFRFVAALVVAWCSCAVQAQIPRHHAVAPDPVLERQLVASGFLQRPLPLEGKRSMEAMQADKQLTADVPLPYVAEAGRWRHEGLGRLSVSSEGLLMCLPIETGRRPQGAPDDSDYALFGSCRAVFDVGGQDWSGYNRIAMDIYPRCEGEGIMNMNLYLDNGTYADVGAHLINLRNNQWNHITFETSSLGRNHVRSLTFYTDLKGRNLFKGDSLSYLIRNVRLQTVVSPEKERGWQPDYRTIVYSMSGYRTDGRKTAIIEKGMARRFLLVRTSDGKIVFRGSVTDTLTTIGHYGFIDFTPFRQPGTYRLYAGTLGTDSFRIGDDVFVNSEWRVLNNIFCQRCGWHVEGIHAACHADLLSVHNGQTRSYAGGWHDAGDLSQQTLQSADVAYALLEASVLHRKDNPVLSRRLQEEAEWGLRFVLRQRLGDGWHASSMGLLHWTDGKQGTYDDIRTVRTQNCSYDNFLYAAYEAYAALVLADAPALADSLRQAAVEDFRFAREKYEREGPDPFPHMMEHTYNTSQSLRMATMSWAASMLFRLTADEEYARLAANYINYVLDCQETQGQRPELQGFFYRDTTRRAIVHFIHQSREQLFAQSLTALCQTQPNHPDCGRWQQALRLYGNYLKSLMQYTAPYGMVPSGVYQTEEWRDTLGFRNLHLFAPDDAPRRYDAQLRQGIQLDDRHYVRRFPTWFSIFNGNEAILLSMGKAAAVCGNYLHDSDLLAIGQEQLYWTVGKNPFSQSLIYGEGYNYPSMDSFSSGEMIGEMPVGIRASGDADEPYWPQTNNACYKEVWTTVAGKWLSLIAEFPENTRVISK